MTTPPAGISGTVRDGEQTLLRVTRDHAISEDWLHDHTPDLYRAWQHARTAAERDHIAGIIDRTFSRLEDKPPKASPRGDRAPVLHDLLTLIEDYEIDLIATGQPRTDATPERLAVQRHATAEHLEETRAMVELRLRDWAEPATPELLERWHTQVAASGEYDSGRAAMRAIAAAHHWAGVLHALDPRLAGKTALPRLAEALEQARAGGHQLDAELPALIAGLRTSDPVRELTRRIVAACECRHTPDRPAPAQPTRSDGRVVAPRTQRVPKR